MQTNTSIKSANPAFDAKLQELDKLTELVKKIDEAMLGEEPQMRKVYRNLRKSAVEKMAIVNSELKKLARDN